VFNRLITLIYRILPSRGYSSKKLALVVAEKTKTLRNSAIDEGLSRNSLKIVNAIDQASKSKKIAVLDFGGAGGQHFYEIPLQYQEKISKWIIVETQEMMDANIEHAHDKLSWTTTVQLAHAIESKIDLVIASNSLQYTSDPIETLKSLMSIEATYCLISRLILTHHYKKFQFSQVSDLAINGPGPLPRGMKNSKIKYKATVESYNKFTDVLCHRYKIISSETEISLMTPWWRPKVSEFSFLALLKSTN